jgi:signal transduction histidine kinase/CheY-like chemotaxis protein
MEFGLLQVLFGFFGLLSFGYAFSLILYLGTSGKPVIILWIFFALIQGIATLLTINRQPDNLLITFVLANSIAFVSHIFAVMSFRAALGKVMKTHLIIIYISIIGFAHFISLNAFGSYSGPEGQTIFLSSMMGLIHLIAANYAFQIYQLNRNRHALAIAISFIVAGLLWLARIYLVIYGMEFNAFSKNIFSVTLLCSIFILGIMRYFFFYGVLYSLENQALQSVNRLLEEKNELLKALGEEKLKSEKANVAKGQFLANISHEIRTPLHGVIGLISVILKSPISEDIRKSLGKVLYSSKALLVILNDILDFSKIEAGGIEIHEDAFKVKHLMDDVQDLFLKPATDKGIALRFDVDPTTPEVLIGDFYKLRQILFNLVGNSIKFTQQGFVEVKVRVNHIEEEAARLTLTVKDSGIGISDKHLHVIFEPFNQLDNTNTRRYDGVGLGLPITRNILLKMGSDLVMRSQPGVGTEATFELQLKINHGIEYKHRTIQTSGLEEVSIVHYPSLVGRHVLVAEDNPINVEVVRQYLNYLKIESHFVTDGFQCLEALKKKKYDCVLMDIQMPNLDGIHTTSQIRLIDELKDLPIIGLSAGVAYKNREDGIQSGMNDFLVKPFEVEGLAEMLIKHLPA